MRMSAFPAYPRDVWDALVSAVESDMGTLLPDRCLGQELTFHSTEDTGAKTALSCRCKKQSMLVTIYDPADNDVQRAEMLERGAGYARVCGNCDAVGHWPRYIHVLEA